MTPKIKRSKSFPNDSETTDRVAELEDLLSSRSGFSETSTNKPQIDEDEEDGEDWKDASPVTPICSPARPRPSRLRQRDKRSPTRYVDVDNDVEIIHEFYPTTSKTMHEETSIVSYGGTIIVETTRIPRHTKDMTTRMEKMGPKVKLKKQSSVEVDRVPPVQEEPSSSAEETSKITTRSLRETERERRKNLKRRSSAESEGRTSTSRETLEKSDTSSEKGAKKKVFAQKEDASRRKPESLGDEEIRKKAEDSYRRSREERKSLKEQECIERVTEFLTRHGILTVPTYPDTSLGAAESLVPERYEDAQPEKQAGRPSAIGKEEETPSVDAFVAKRRESLKKVPQVVIEAKDSLRELRVTAKDASRRSSESKRQRPILERASAAVSDVQQPDTAVQEPAKRPSSLRKRRDSFSRESSRESLLEEKKEVRIQEDVQEIFFEDTSEQITELLPEVQLVKARIITAEEATALRSEETVAKIEIHSPPEVVTGVGRKTIKPKLVRAPSPEVVSSLQLPSLAKSTSDSTLAQDRPEPGEDRKVSVRNLKPEILLDLSKVSDNGEESEETPEDGRDHHKERRFSRTGSEGSKRLIKSQREEEFPFKVSSLALPDRPELMVLRDGDTTRTVEDADDEISRSRREGYIGAPKDLPIPPSEVAVDRAAQDRLEERKDTKEGRDSGQTPLREKRSPLLEEVVRKHEEDSLICKEHSLEYQSQTLESQSDHLFHEAIVPYSLPEDLSEAHETCDESISEVERSFKETHSQYSPKEKRDVQTQTVQESKSTQCSPEQSVTSPSEEPSSAISPFRVGQKYFQSPKREVQTQTQDENKSVQCSLDDLGDLASARSDAADRSQESKSIQCIPEDIPARSSDRSRSSSREDVLLSPRREVEVQTYQESKAIQCSDDELLLEADQTSTDRPEYSLQSRPTSSTSRKTESTPSSTSSSPRKFPTVVFVERRGDMTVTHREHDGDVAWSKHWGPERLVEIYREPKTSLGLSIVGGKVDLHNGGSSKSQNISGIFIKNVLPNSPAGRTGGLKIGDRIIEVDGVDLRHSTHERAVEVIQAAGNPVCLLVQSLVHMSPEHGSNAVQEERDKTRRQTVKSHTSSSSGTPTASFRRKLPPVSPARSITPEVIQPGLEDDAQSLPRGELQRQSTKSADGSASSSRRSSMKKSIRRTAPQPPVNPPGILREVSEEREDHAAKPDEKRQYSWHSESSDEDDEEDTRMLEGNVYTKSGVEISRKSAGNVKRTKEEIEVDPEDEDEYGYTNMKIQKKYHNLGHKVLMVILEKDRSGLGISLAGHKDRNRMAVFICGLNPKGAAYKNGGLAIGDEILEINGFVLQGRCHLNASALIKGMAGTRFKIIVYRRSKAVNDIAVKPIVQFPPTLDDVFKEFSKYKGVREIQVKKSQYGLGIMIIEGKHLAVGQGIFVSDIQEGSAAEQAGLQIGDMILAVNLDSLLGRTYDEATELLKKAEGVVKLTVCNPNENKTDQEQTKGKDDVVSPAKNAQKTPQKTSPTPAKEPEKPKEQLDPKTCSIPVGQEVTIEFQKEKNQIIGIYIAGGSDTLVKGVFVLDLFPDGAAMKDGRLQLGDQILSIGGVNFKDIEYVKARETILKQAAGPITMSVLRHEKPAEEYEVEIQKKSGRGAGICFAAFRSGKGAYVSELTAGGPAIETGKICRGDHLLAISGLDVREVSLDDIAFHMKISNPLQLKLARYKSAKQ